MKYEVNEAKDCVRLLRALCDPDDDHCAIAAAHKLAVSLYVRTWILPKVEAWAERADRKATIARERARFVVGERVEYRLGGKQEEAFDSWVDAEVTAVEPARGVARNRQAGTITVRTLAGCATHVLPHKSMRLRKIPKSR